MSGDQGIKIVDKDGAMHLSGVLDEYADLSPLLKKTAPLVLNMRHVARLNSMGVRGFLKFLGEWGTKAFSYEECPSEFVDQLNMIPALLGTNGQGVVKSLFVPYECENCNHDVDLPAKIEEFEAVVRSGGELPTKPCPKCGSPMTVLTDSFFSFLGR